MNNFDSFFPKMPDTLGSWSSIYLEPIVGSGERISIIAVATSGGRYKVNQSIRNEVIDCLYGKQAEKIRAIINLLILSIEEELDNKGHLSSWKSPIHGVFLGQECEARGDDLSDILTQAITFSASLSVTALDAERVSDDVQPRKYSEQWSRSISLAMSKINPSLVSSFGRKVQLGSVDIQTTFGFIHNDYSANFGLLVPNRLTSSLNNVKARLLDLEKLKKSSLIIKPNDYDIIVGSPSYQDPTLTKSVVAKLKENFSLIEEFATTSHVNVFRATSADDAAEYINSKIAA